jgi:hypothetical protein
LQSPFLRRLLVLMNWEVYRQLLLNLEVLLDSVNEKQWSALLHQWITELDLATDNATLQAHVTRTRKALGGMGSLGDICISHRNGLAQTYPEDLLPDLHRRFMSLLSSVEKLIQ